jgi:uncharacterized protein (DUF342 family)
MLVAKKIFCMRQDSNGSNNRIHPILDLRARIEKNRVNTLKDNLNKLAGIASADLRLIYDSAIELDNIHKQMFDYKTDTEKAKKSEDDVENIFKKED